MKKNLLGLGVRECRYPVQEDPFLFCAAVTDGRSYCPAHDAVCYQRGTQAPLAFLEAQIRKAEKTIRALRSQERDTETAPIEGELRFK